jgi:hypothetical protein
MTSERTPDRAPNSDPEDGATAAPEAGHSPDDVRVGRLQRRREKIAAEIERNRRGEYSVPTWVLAAALVVIIAGWAALIIFG